MRPLITHDEIELLKRDLDTLGEQNLVGIEAYEASPDRQAGVY